MSNSPQDVCREVAEHVKRVTGKTLVIGESLNVWPWLILEALEILSQRVATLEDQLKK
jgi:hypothetical protein